MNEISTDDSPLMNGFWTKFNPQRKLNEIERDSYESLRFLNKSLRTDKRIVNGFQRITNEIERNLNEFDQIWVHIILNNIQIICERNFNRWFPSNERILNEI